MVNAGAPFSTQPVKLTPASQPSLSTVTTVSTPMLAQQQPPPQPQQPPQVQPPGQPAPNQQPPQPSQQQQTANQQAPPSSQPGLVGSAVHFSMSAGNDSVRHHILKFHFILPFFLIYFGLQVNNNILFVNIIHFKCTEGKFIYKASDHKQVI